jgi:prevent-host-death family protein
MATNLSSDVVGVRELRQNLSVYLRRVQRGETLRVTEHRRVVAVLGPAARTEDALAQLIADGRASAAKRTPRELRPALRLKLRKPLSQHVRELGEDTI